MPQFSMPPKYMHMESANERFDAECKKVVEQGMKFGSHTDMARHFFEAGAAWEYGKKMQKHHAPADWELVAKTAAYYAHGYEHQHSKFGSAYMLGTDGNPIIDKWSYNAEKYSGMHFKFDMPGLVAFIEEIIKIYL
jgi:hypothetical protein